MKLQYFGTAAAEGIPAIFCDCSVCQEARKKKGRYIRTRSQAMIDDKLLVDFNADTYMHSLKYGVNLSALKHLFVTHVHEDHYYPAELLNRRKGYSPILRNRTLTVHGSEDLPLFAEQEWQAISADGSTLAEHNRVVFDVLRPYERTEIDGYFVTALPAVHGTPHPYLYIFEKDGKTLFYRNDSGYLTEEHFAYLREKGIRFDLVSYECTWGDEDAGGAAKYHLGLPNAIIERQRFIENGNYKDGTISVITHFSHNIRGAGYGNMKKAAKKHGFVLAYDGMKIEF
ncbi:MAG: hypothetical protein IJY63_04525 [Clostridia bacterium]|nr:hypothetical protein [Clostridia bacterium]